MEVFFSLKCKITRRLIHFLSLFVRIRGGRRFKQEWFTYHYLKKYLKVDESLFSNLDEGGDNTIWVYWNTGIESAPSMVKKCIQSIHENRGGYNLVILDNNNLFDYVSLPTYIIEKHKCGKISIPQFTDLVRVSLLIQNGGVWMDSTCFLSSRIPDYVCLSKLFVFQTQLFDNPAPIRSSSWFIKASKGNEVLIRLQSILFEYWNEHDVLIDYYLLHIALGLLIDKDPVVKEQWEKVYYVNNQNPHVLQYSFAKKYSCELWNHCLNQCFVHKLNYKFDQSLLNEPNKNIIQHFLH